MTKGETETTKNTTPQQANTDIEDIIKILQDINKINTDIEVKDIYKSNDNTNKPSTGLAGQSRTKVQRRPSEPCLKPRNTKRGIRSRDKTEERKENRTRKRREARQKQRTNKRGKGKNKDKSNRERAATAQKPQNRIRLGTKFKIATINIRGLIKTGAREEIEKWMKDNDIMIAAIQETNIGSNTMEARGSYIWYMSGETKSKEAKYTAGVGFVINNKFKKYVEDVIPHTDRIMQIKLKGTCNINLINIYMPQANRAEEEKEAVYKKLDEITSKTKGKGPTYILGDWNARMQKQQNSEEAQVFGKWTLEPEKTKVHELSEEVQWNRNRAIQFCRKHKFILANTKFQKVKEKIATFRPPSTIRGVEISHTNHEQIDYIAVQQRWKNSVLDAESDTNANIKSDHYPVIATIRIKLRATKKGKGPGRQKYKESTKEQMEERRR